MRSISLNHEAFPAAACFLLRGPYAQIGGSAKYFFYSSESRAFPLRLRCALHVTFKKGEYVRVMNGLRQKARFAALILPFLSDAYALARSLAGNYADAEDVVQEACLRAYRAIDSVEDSSARAWFLTITHHTACTWLRKNRPAALVAVEDLEAVELSASDPGEREIETPESSLIAKTDQARLEAAIAALPLAFRETILLRDIEGLNYRQIAQVTGVPIGTVMSRLARARDRLMAMLGDRLQ